MENTKCINSNDLQSKHDNDFPSQNENLIDKVVTNIQNLDENNNYDENAINNDDQNDNYAEDENDNYDENADFNENEENLNYEEENENENFDDNEMVIDTCSGSDLGIDDNESIDYSLSILKSVVSTYSAFMYDSPAILTSYGCIIVNLPAYFLPLSLQSVYGFDVDHNILNIEIQLDDQDWTKTPSRISIQHPVYKSSYVGLPLIKAVLDKFFSKEYKPKHYYRSESYLLFPTGKSDPQLQSLLISEGFDSKCSERALIICSNDIDQAREFLCTGAMPEHDSILSIDYSTCPLLYLMLEFADCFLDLQDHCCVCRAAMDPGLKPSVCSKDLCNFRLNQIGLGGSIVQEIQRDPLAADLLVSLFSAAVSTEYLNPSPPESIDNIENLLQKLPPMDSLKKLKNDAELKHLIHQDMCDLLRWILLSNRSQIISLPAEYQLKEFPNTYQFMTLISTPESEKVFKELKSDYGSIFLWHGSNGIRWHSIIRNGLKNCSGTKMEANGAALGPGIYMARNSMSSWQYSRVAKNKYCRSKLGSQLHIIGLCEVANMSDVGKKGKRRMADGPPLIDHGWAHTLTMEEACVVRFLFVDSGKSNNLAPQPFSVDVIQKPPTKVPTLRDLLNYLSGHK